MAHARRAAAARRTIVSAARCAKQPQMGTHVSMGGRQQPDVGLKDLAGAVVRIADALDRAVFVLEEIAVSMNIVHPDDVGPSPSAQRIADT